MSTYLKTNGGGDVAAYQSMTRNIAAGQVEVGTGGAAGQFLRVDKHTGAVTFGRDALPLPPDHRFALGLHNIMHGYVEWSTAQKQPVDRQMVSMGRHPVPPAPPGGKYVGFGEDGCRKCVELTFDSIDEPGFSVTFSSMSISNDNRIRRCLLEPIAARDGSPDADAGFIHPVVKIGSDSYKHATYGVIHTIDFEIVDWLHADGKTLLSARGGSIKKPEVGGVDGGQALYEQARVMEAAAAETAPWDDDDDMTDAERDLLRA